MSGYVTRTGKSASYGMVTSKFFLPSSKHVFHYFVKSDLRLQPFWEQFSGSVQQTDDAEGFEIVTHRGGPTNSEVTKSPAQTVNFSCMESSGQLTLRHGKKQMLNNPTLTCHSDLLAVQTLSAPAFSSYCLPVTALHIPAHSQSSVSLPMFLYELFPFHSASRLTDLLLSPDLPPN